MMNNPIHTLKKRFPYQFQSNIGIDIARGWAETFVQLCEAIDEVTRQDPQGRHYGFHWRQVKEKFGTARLYYRMDGADRKIRVDLIDGNGGVVSLRMGSTSECAKTHGPVEEVSRLIDAAEARLHGICIVCGDMPAEIDRTGGYLLKLCAHHAHQRNVDRVSMDSPLFED